MKAVIIKDTKNLTHIYNSDKVVNIDITPLNVVSVAHDGLEVNVYEVKIYFITASVMATGTFECNEHSVNFILDSLNK